MEKRDKRIRTYENGLRVAPLLVPAATITTMVFIIPLAMFFRYSLNQYIPGKFMETAFTLDSFKTILSDNYYYSIMWRTIKMALLATSITLFCAYPVAETMARTKGGKKSAFVIALVFPMMLGSVIRSMGWMGLLSKSGLVNKLLIQMGIIEEALKLMYTEGAVIAAVISMELPLMILTLVTAIESINPDLEQAALNMGASKAQAFLKIKLPLTVPGIIAGTSLVFVQSMNTYSTAKMIGGAKIQTMATAIYAEMNELLNWPAAAALSLILLVFTLAVTYVYAHILETRYVKVMHL